MKTELFSKKKLLIPAILTFSWIPLIMHLYSYDTGLSNFPWASDELKNVTDTFLYYKMIAVITIGLIMLSIILYCRIIKHLTLPFEYSFVFLFAYGICVGLSAFFSDFKTFAIFGSYEMFESAPAIISYIIFCYYMYFIIRNSNDLNTFFIASSIGICLLLAIGTGQLIGHDLFNSTLGKKLITNPDMWSSLDQLTVTTGKHLVYATLYNPNFVAGYCIMLIPVVIAILSIAKSMTSRLIVGLFLILFTLCLFGSQSFSGILGLAAGTIVGLIILLSKCKNHFIFVALLIFAILISTPFVFQNKAKITDAFVTPCFDLEKDCPISAIDTTIDGVTFHFKNEGPLTFYYTLDSNNNFIPAFRNASGNILNITRSDGEEPTYSLDDASTYGPISVTLSLSGKWGQYVTIDIIDTSFRFTNASGYGYQYINEFDRAVAFENPEKNTLFPNGLLSYRGIIWDYIIPVAKEKSMLLGTGANTTVAVYPQDAYLEKHFLQTESRLDVKAHNFYLQQWLEEGLLALLLLIIFFGCYIVKFTRIFRRSNLNDPLVRIGFGIFIGIIAELFSFFVNDSNINTSPVFWILLGTGMAVNKMLSEKE